MDLVQKVRRGLASFRSIEHTTSRLADTVEKLQTLEELFSGQASFIKKNSPEIVDVAPEFVTGAMKCVKNTWLPLEEGRFPLWMDEAGNYQAGLYREVVTYVKKRGVAVDAGANIGFLSRLMVKDFQTVHAFEPVQLNRACLARNVQTNNCIIYPFALGSTVGESLIEISPIASGGAQIGGLPENSLVHKAVKRQEKIRIVSLDSLNLPELDFLKIDVQGFEYEVLNGAKSLLTRCSPTVLIEIEVEGQQDKGAVKFLESIGYVVRKRIGKDAILTK